MTEEKKKKPAEAEEHIKALRKIFRPKEKKTEEKPA